MSMRTYGISQPPALSWYLCARSQIDVMIRAPELITRVIEELGKDSRVKMKY